MDHLLQSYLTIMLVLKIIDSIITLFQLHRTLLSSNYPLIPNPTCTINLSYHLVLSPTITLSLVPFPTILSPVLPSSCPLTYHLVPSPTIKLSPFLPSCPQSYHQVVPCPLSYHLVPFPTILSPVLPSHPNHQVVSLSPVPFVILVWSCFYF